MKMLGAIMVALGILMVLGVGADFADYTASRSAHIAVVADDQELIDLTPMQPYAYIDDRGVLVIDFSANNPNYQNESLNPGWWGIGISPDSRYNFNDVFNVSNDLWDNVTILVTISSSNPFVELYTHNEESLEGAWSSDSALQEISFYVYPGGEVSVGMHLMGWANDAGDWLNGTLTIHAEPADNGG